jgi:DNA repair protein SbcD/Mre11
VFELRRLIEDEVSASDAYLAEVDRIADELRGQLPSECRDLLGEDEASYRAAIAELIREGADDVVARMHATAVAAE